MNREQWLTQIAESYIRPLFREKDASWPTYRVSIGFPKGSRGGKHSIGQCWPTHLSGDKTSELFISPELKPFEAVDTLIHELVHASVGCKEGHKGAFRKLAVAVGLEGKMTATVAGTKLTDAIKGWLADMAEFPGAPLRVERQDRQTTRMLKLECAGCGYTVRTTRKWIDTGYLPYCVPCEKVFQVG